MKPKHALILIVWTALITSALAPTEARAACLTQNLDMIWSYPADGAADVPTNLPYLWVLTSTGRQPRSEPITLNGAPLVLGPHKGSYVLPDLAPNTRYEVSVPDAYPPHSTNTAKAPLTFTFTTGDGPRAASSPLSISINGATKQDARSIGACGISAMSAQTCLDSAPFSAVAFDASVERGEAIVWMLQPAEGAPGQVTWPATCGAPTIWMYDEQIQDPKGCVTLVALDAFGVAVERGPYCGTDHENSGGCQITTLITRTQQSAPWWMLLAVGGVAALYLRRRRPLLAPPRPSLAPQRLTKTVNR